MIASGSIAALARGRDRVIPAILVLSAVLLVLGLYLPILRVDRFFLFSRPFSIVDSLVALLETDEYFLFTVIFCFTVIFPVTKLAWAIVLWARIDVHDPRFDRTIEILDTLGKWSMLDVMLLAVGVASIKLSLVGGAHANPGLYLFCGAIILAMVGSHWLKAAAKRIREDSHFRPR